MATLLEMPRNSSARRSSFGRGRIELKTEALTLPQPFGSQTPPDEIWEETVVENRGLGSTISKDALLGVKPLPWRQCAVLMVLSSLAVYGVGFLIVAAFNHLFHYLQL